MTDYQGEYVIIGPPGCGKTHRISRSVQKIVDYYRDSPLSSLNRTPVMVCSLTRTAAREAAGRIDLPRQMVGTLHAHAYRAIGHPDVVDGKALAEWNDAYPQYRISGAVTNQDEPDWDKMQSLEAPGDTLHMSLNMKRAAMTPESEWPDSVKRFDEKYRAWKQGRGLVDFSDMIEIAAANDTTAPGDPRVVIADEAQDMSASEFDLLQRWGAKAGASIMVGDPYQSLYVWRGASPESLLRDDLEKSHRDVLSQSYRVPCAVHEKALSIVEKISYYRDIEYSPTDEAGEVGRCPGFRDAHQVVRLAGEELDAGRTVMIQASCSYMLKPIIDEMRSKGMTYSNPWRLSNGAWNPTSGKGISGMDRLRAWCSCDPELGDGSYQWSMHEFHKWASKLKSKGVFVRGGKADVDRWLEESPSEVTGPFLWGNIMEHGFLDKLTQLMDARLSGDASRRDWIEFLLGHVTATARRSLDYPAACVIEHGKVAFDPPGVYIGTIHSFKGAEADTVIVAPDLSRSGYKEYMSSQTGGTDGVLRMFYVAVTRAKQRLLLAAPSSKMSFFW